MQSFLFQVKQWLLLLVYCLFECYCTRESSISLMIKFLNLPSSLHPVHNFTQEIHLLRSFPQPRPMTPKVTYLTASSRRCQPMPIKARLERFLVITQSALYSCPPICQCQQSPKTLTIWSQVTAIGYCLYEIQLILRDRTFRWYEHTLKNTVMYASVKLQKQDGGWANRF